MSASLDLVFSTISRIVVIAILTSALLTIYRLCISLWSIICVVRRMKWPSVTFKFIRHPKFLQTFYNSEVFLSLLYDVTKKDATTEYETSFAMFGSTVLLITTINDYAQALLTSPKSVNKAEMYQAFRDILGEMLLTTPAPEYRAARKTFMPYFHKSMITTFIPTILDKHILETASQFENHVNKGEFDVANYVEKCILKAVTDFLIGVPTYESVIDQLIHLTKGLSTNIFTSAVRWWKLPGFIHKITPEGKANKRLLREAGQLFAEAIRKRTDLVEKNAELRKMIELEDDDDTEKVLLDILIDPKRTNGGSTFAELAMFIEAGSSTSIHTINGALMMLAYHPEEQRKVYEELYDIYGSTSPEDVPVVLSDHQRMHRLQLVIKETLRLFSPISFIARSVEEDIRIGNETIPKGCDACIFIYAMHRSEQYWPDPLKFDPDRFLPENSVDRPPWVYIPFSDGPRKCPGYTMALAMITQFLATILRKYMISADSITLVKDIKMKMKVGSSFIDPVKIKLQRRQHISATKLVNGGD